MSSNGVRGESGAETQVPDPHRWLVLGALSCALFVLLIDAMVLNVAIPTLMRQLGASPSDIQWILDAYVLVYAGLLLTTGSLSDRYGRRRFLVIGLAVFGCASGLAAFAAHPWQLIAARAFMGVGGALLLPSTLSILMTTFVGAELRKAFAVWSVVSTIGTIGGPIVGGLFIQHFWWGAVFLVNVPVAALAIVAALVLMPESRGEARPLDPAGAVLSVVGLSALVFVVIEAPRQGFNVPVAALAVVVLGAFCWWEVRTEHPMLPLELFRSRDFTASSSSILLMMFGIGALLLMLTQYLQFVLGFGAMAAGLGLVPFAAASMVFNYVGGALGNRVSNKTLVVSGMVVMAAGFAGLAMAGGYWAVCGSMLAMGVGSGLCGPAAYTTLMSAVPAERAGAGSALNDTIQQVGLALSTAVLGSVLAGIYTARMPAGMPAPARASIGQAVLADDAVARAGRAAFSTAMSVGSWVGTVCCLLASVVAAVTLRSRVDTPEVAAR